MTRMPRGLPQWARKFASKRVATAHEEKKFLTHSLYESAKRRANEAIERAPEVAEYERPGVDVRKKALPRNKRDAPTVPRRAVRRGPSRGRQGRGVGDSRRAGSIPGGDDGQGSTRPRCKRARGDAEKPGRQGRVRCAPPLRLLNDEAPPRTWRRTAAARVRRERGEPVRVVRR